METREIRKQVRRLIREHGPMTRMEILKGFNGQEVGSKAVNQTINNLISLQILFPATGNQVWDQDQEEILKRKAKNLISEKDLSRTQLADALLDLDTGVSKYHIEKNLFAALLNEPDIYLKYRGNTQLLTKDRASLEELTKPLARSYQRIELVLEKSNYSKREIQEAIVGKGRISTLHSTSKPNGFILPPPEKERDIDYQRDAARLLVIAWRDTENNDTKIYLEGVMKSLGLKEEGNVGEVVNFDGLIHDCNEPTSKDEEVKVESSGWRLINRRGNYLINKATVRKV
ncbi:MAG: hypothetical protein P1V20_09385 [Verrucomicrobiales bacterium]|nr:hypothetical protein [Verrucomicrobiales bacterium]